MTDFVPGQEFTPAPGPAARVQRTAGQVGGVVVLLELWFAFGWFGSEEWTERQVLAVTAVAYVAASAAQNVAGWLRARGPEVAPVEPAALVSEERGASDVAIVVAALVIAVALVLVFGDPG